MAKDFILQFSGLALTVGQPLVFSFMDKKLLGLCVKSLEAIDASASMQGDKGKAEPRKTQFGRLLGNTTVTFEKAENSSLNLVGKAKGKVVRQSIINPDWDFGKMGIGGLDNEFNAIFRRAFASRVFPPEIVEQLGCKHVKGILLYGPPGTGKTLMARQIGNMLNAREPKIVNGPQILDKEEEKRLGPNSGLHIIIFDEIDAICKARGSVGGNSGVHDTVVNQLLAKIDGVEQLNNILVIGMTNRRDMIDEALMRPGRLERRGVIAKRVVDGERCVRAVASETRGKVVPVRRKAEQLKRARSQTRKIKRGKAEPGAKFRDKKRLHRSKARHAISRSVPHSSFSAWSVAAERIKGASLARNLANTEHPPSSSSTSRRPIRKRSKAKRPSQEGLFSHTLSAHRARRA
ncbi:hypothetical protein quinque_014102 [Culex quinquefasciatus]